MGKLDRVRALGVWLSTNPNITLGSKNQSKLLEITSSIKGLILSHLAYILLPLPTNRLVIGQVNNFF